MNNKKSVPGSFELGALFHQTYPLTCPLKQKLRGERLRTRCPLALISEFFGAVYERQWYYIAPVKREQEFVLSPLVF